MTPAQVLIGMYAKEKGLELLVLPGAAQVRVSSARGLVIMGSQQMSLDDAVGALRAAEDHPEWEAVCPGCTRVYVRAIPARVTHHCSACGPVAGKLEFQ